MELKILIVDDNPMVRKMICRVVADHSDEVNEVEDGAEALSAYAKFLPDWVLMDLQMKEMNGIAATAAIRAAFPDANVVIVTNHDSAFLREKAHQAGARGYVLKENLLDLRGMLTTPV